MHWDPLPLCHTGQREAVADAAQTQAWVTTRRAGKTRGAVYAAGAAALATAGVNVLYLSTSIKRAVRTLWDELLAANRMNEWGGTANHTNHCLRLPNGSQIHVSGCETRVEADAWRGVLPRTVLVFVDEGQDWKDDLLRYVYGDVIIPSLADIGGRFILAGTPGSPRGFFYDFTRRVGRHSWSLFSNPHVKDAAMMMAEAMRVRGCDETDPSIRREFYAEFVADSVRQIFPYRDDLNGYDPADLPAGKWSYVLGADFGTVDACAVVVWGYSDASPHRWLIEAQRQTGLGGTAQVAMVREIAERYPKGLITHVGDPGGGGKALITDLRQEHWLPMEVAEKQGKAAACMTMRDGLRSGVVRIPRALTEFVTELQEPEWDPDAIGSVIRGHMPDRIDAALYGYRKLASLHHYTAPPPVLNEGQRILHEAYLEQQAAEERLSEWGGSNW